MAILLIRHGQTDWNLARRLQSRTDVPLNGTGRRQAGSIRDALAAKGIHPVTGWSSPLARAVVSARVILGGEPAVDARLLEIDLGCYEGRLESDLRAESGARYDQWRALRFTVAAPGGENVEQAMARVERLVGEIAGRAVGTDVLVVGHQYVNTAIKAVLSGRADVDSLRGFVQDNDEVDIWEADGTHRQRFRAAPGASGAGGWPPECGRDMDRLTATST